MKDRTNAVYITYIYRCMYCEKDIRLATENINCSDYFNRKVRFTCEGKWNKDRHEVLGLQSLIF